MILKDGYFQSLPYHWFIYLFPFNKYLYLFSFIFVNFWSISIHDQLYVSEDSFVNGAAHHTLHHREFNYNYGQYFTLWDKIGGSYKRPEEFFEEKHTGHVIPAARERKPDDEPESDGEVRPVDSRPARKEKSEGANGVGATPARRRTKKAQ